MDPPVLKRVERLDSIPLSDTYWMEEGYLRDKPVVTSIGIFEYRNKDGTVRRELRLPEHVFDPDSLASYQGKPIILTHRAGIVDKDNVDQEHIGTILSPGIPDGDDVRADIIIHDTDAIKRSGLRELSLGYSLDLDETPGTWNGQPYDAIQTNIRINHLALVGKARAGEQARLNIDSRDEKTEGGTAMDENRDGLTPEQLDEAKPSSSTRPGRPQTVRKKTANLRPRGTVTTEKSPIPSPHPTPNRRPNPTAMTRSN